MGFRRLWGARIVWPRAECAGLARGKQRFRPVRISTVPDVTLPSQPGSYLIVSVSVTDCRAPRPVTAGEQSMKGLSPHAAAFLAIIAVTGCSSATGGSETMQPVPVSRPVYESEV